eukprot:g3339.t1
MSHLSGPNQMDQEQYTAVLNEMIPYISDFVDNNGGLVSLSLLSQDPKVKQWQAEIPTRYDRKITKILARNRYKDFFQCLEGGRVATYKAYENGLIDEEGNVKKNVPGGAKMKPVMTIMPTGNEASGGTELQRGVGGATAGGNPFASGGEDVVETAGQGGEPAVEKNQDGEELTLMDVMDQMQQAVFLEDGTDFVAAIQKIRKIRKTSFGYNDDYLFQTMLGASNGGPSATARTAPLNQMPGSTTFPAMQGSPIDPSDPIGSLKRPAIVPGAQILCPSSVQLADPKNPRERHERLTLVTREMVSCLRDSPGKTLTVIELTQKPKIQLLKKGIVSKFTQFLQQNADKFLIGKNPDGDNKSDVVTLVLDDCAIDDLLTSSFDLDCQYMDMFPELAMSGPNAPGSGAAKKMQKTNSFNNSKGGGYGKGKGKGSYGGGGYGSGGYGGGGGGYNRY